MRGGGEAGGGLTKQEEAFGGEWTRSKLECLRKYLAAYAKIMNKNKQFRVAYVDAFPGSGYWQEKRDDDLAQLAFP